jgi:hypothetical protein
LLFVEYVAPDPCHPLSQRPVAGVETHRRNDDVVDLEGQWVKRELEKTYRRARALMDEVDANDYEAVCLFESDMEAFCDQYGREPKEPLEWLAWRKDRRREEHGLLLGVMRKQV